MIVLTLAGCREKIVNEEVRPDPTDEVIFSISGQKIFGYNEQTWQDGFNDGNKRFFLISDDGNEWLDVKYSEFPGQVGQIVSVNLEWRTAGMDRTKNKKAVEMEVLSVGEDTGIISLWNAKNSILIGVPNVK